MPHLSKFRSLGNYDALKILLCVFLFFNAILQLGLPGVVTVFMGYLRPKTFDTDFGNHEFLRKPVRESTLIACLREVWSTFESNSNSNLSPNKRTFEISNLMKSTSFTSKSRFLNPKAVPRVPVSIPKVPPQVPVFPLNILVVEGISLPLPLSQIPQIPNSFFAKIYM